MHDTLVTFPEERLSISSPSMERVAAIVLGGGQGTRLFPLTRSRCKPAICFGGRYRLIDVPISNALHAGIEQIVILTQFLSSTLHRHIFQAYGHIPSRRGFIDVLSAEEKTTGFLRFQGTADAVRHVVPTLLDIPADYFLILSGDQLYTMDFKEMVRDLERSHADLSIATIPVDRQNATRMGLLQKNSEGWITRFVEKPEDPAVLDAFQEKGHYLASMGIYLFRRETLFKLLSEHPGIDFGKHLIPYLIEKGRCKTFTHEGYWEDIGTIRSYYEANLALTEPSPPFNYYNESSPFYTLPLNLPGPKVRNGHIQQSILCDGTLIDAERITHSIIGPRLQIQTGTVIEASYLMGNDSYAPLVNDSPHYAERFQIGKNCLIQKAIIDKHVSIGNGVRLTNEKKLLTFDSDNLYVREGILIVPRGATIPDNFCF